MWVTVHNAKIEFKLPLTQKVTFIVDVCEYNAIDNLMSVCKLRITDKQNLKVVLSGNYFYEYVSGEPPEIRFFALDNQYEDFLILLETKFKTIQGEI